MLIELLVRVVCGELSRCRCLGLIVTGAISDERVGIMKSIQQESMCGRDGR